MRIARIEAHGFGALSSEPIELPDGLVVFMGPNEAGKSSRMDLVRFVLFGEKTLGESKRLPAGGGHRSGTVELVDADGRVLRVSRTEKERVVTDGAGRPVPPAELDALIGDARGEIFKAVQTFDSDSISSSRLLKTAEVRENLLMSALLGSGESASTTIKVLEERSGALYARNAKTGDRPYSQRLDALKRARDARSAAKAGNEGYQAVTRRFTEAEEAVRTARRVRDEASARRDDLAADIDLRHAVGVLAELEANASEPVPAVAEALADQARTIALGVAAARSQHEAVGRCDERLAQQQAEQDGARTALGLTAEAPVPDLGAVGTLSRAADTVRAAERELEAARGRLDEARAERAGAARVEAIVAVPSPARHAGLGLVGYAVVGIGLLVAVVGLLIGAKGLGIAGAVVAVVGVGLTLLRAQAPTPAASLPSSLDGLITTRSTELEAAQAALDAAAAAWTAAVAALGLAAGLAVGQLDDVRTRLEQVRSAAAAAVATGDERTAQANPLGRFLEEAAGFVRECGHDAPTDPATLITLAEREAARVEEAIAAAHARVEAETEHRTLVRQAQAAIEAAGGAEAVARIAPLDALELERLHREAGDAIVDAEESLELAIEARVEAYRLQEAAQSSGDVAAAEQAVESAVEDLRDVADRWVAVQLARTMVEEARNEAIRERQRPVTARAAALVGPATDGYWTDLVIGQDGDEPVAIGPGRRLSFAELSKGAAAIVYLCLRIGLVEAFGRSLPEPLPVVMDDTLTHLDDHRRNGIAAAIAGLAQTQQVLYFTCHQEHVDALVAADPGATVIAIDRFV